MIDELLNIEVDDKILDFRFEHNDLPMWLFIRTNVFWHIMSSKLNLSEPHIRVNVKQLPFKEKINYLKYTLFKFPYFVKNKDIFILGSALNNVYENGYFVDRLYDELVDIFQNETILVESSAKFKFYEPRKVKTYYFDLFLIIRKVFSIILKTSKKDEKQILEFVKFLKNKVKIDKEIEVNIKNILYNVSRTSKLESIIWKLLLDRISSKILVMQSAHYGSNINLIVESKKKGIIIAEIQHGFIGKEHYAYNFHPNIHNKIKEYLPNYFLTFGDYWNENINSPVKKVSIGYSYLEKKSKEKRYVDNDSILVVSGGKMEDDYINLTKYLFSSFSNKKIIFRPHPSERTIVNKRYKDLIKLGIEIDYDNLYERLKKIDVVISLELSTVLFEALIFTSKVYLIKSQKTNSSNLENYQDFFIILDTYRSLKLYIENNEMLSIDKIDKIWKKNSIQNYDKFIKGIINNN